MNLQPYIDRLKEQKAEERRQRRKRRALALRTAEELAARLKRDFGARRVYLFGSALADEYFYLTSDIDLAVEGLPKENYFLALFEVNAHEAGFKVDLIELETCDERLKRKVLREGKEL